MILERAGWIGKRQSRCQLVVVDSVDDDDDDDVVVDVAVDEEESRNSQSRILPFLFPPIVLPEKDKPGRSYPNENTHSNEN